MEVRTHPGRTSARGAGRRDASQNRWAGPRTTPTDQGGVVRPSSTSQSLLRITIDAIAARLTGSFGR